MNTLLLAVLLAVPETGNPRPAKMLFDFDGSVDAWRAIDDVVMGGRSASFMVVEGGLASFRGRVSLENNGGFASIRSATAHRDLSPHDGLELHIRGDGKRYGLRLRTDRQADGVNFQAPIETVAGEWTRVRVPFDAFVPLFRGRRVPDHPTLDPGRIQTVGFIISDKQAGEFRLDIEWIGAYPAACQRSVDGSVCE